MPDLVGGSPMKLRIAAATAALLLFFSPAGVLASAYGPYVYKMTAGVQGTWTNFCLRAGIADVAINKSDTKALTSTGADCSGSPRIVPSGYLAASVSGYRNGSYCGNSGNFYSNVATWGWGVSWQACGNPAGSQTFYTRAYGAIYDDASKCPGCNPQYFWFNHTGPSQNY